MRLKGLNFGNRPVGQAGLIFPKRDYPVLIAIFETTKQRNHGGLEDWARPKAERELVVDDDGVDHYALACALTSSLYMSRARCLAVASLSLGEAT